MTTKKQTQALLTRLAGREPDLVVADSSLVLRPLHHMCRSIRILRASYGADAFLAEWCAGPLFGVMTHGAVQFAERIHPKAKGLWLWTDPSHSIKFEEICSSDVLPRLRKITVLDDLMKDRVLLWGRKEIATDRWPGVHPDSDEALACLAALGRLTEAKALALRRRASATTPPTGERTYYTDDERQRLLTLCDIVEAEDRPALAKLLRTWEEETVRRWKLEHLWQPTPFPFELQG